MKSPPHLSQHRHSHTHSPLHMAMLLCALQMVRFAFPFVFIAAVFGVLSWILEPMPNLLRKNEFLRYRRELLYIASKLNYRSPAKEVGGAGRAGRV